MLTALSSAALRGVDVRILVPKNNDIWVMGIAARSYYPRLLDVGACDRRAEGGHGAGALAVDDQPLGGEAPELGVAAECGDELRVRCALERFYGRSFGLVPNHAVNTAAGVVAVVSKGDEQLVRQRRCTGWHFPRDPRGGYLGYPPAGDLAAIANLEVESLQHKMPTFHGDTIYADGPIQAEVKLPDGTLWKNITTEEKSKAAETLNEFRGAHKYNLLDVNVRRFHSEVPQIWQWDDHEV